MTFMLVVHSVLIFLFIGAMSVTMYHKRQAIVRYGSPGSGPRTMTMKRASGLALGVLAAAPAAAVVSVLLGALTSNIVRAATRLPAEFWQTLGTILLAGGIPLAIFIIAREIIFAIGKDFS